MASSAQTPAAAAAASSSAAAATPSHADSHTSLQESFCALVDLGPLHKNNNQEFSREFLEGHGWNVEAAVNAYLEMKAAADEGGFTSAAAAGAEQVRAPLPSVEERLYDESPEELVRRAHLHGMLLQGRLPPELAFEQAATSSLRLRSARSMRASVDPFRNFADEAASWRPAAAASSSPAAAGAAVRKPQRGIPNLSKLFAPPDELLLTGSRGESVNFDSAAAEALRQRKWLLINVQQADEFSTHQLNRDVWRNPAVHALVKSHFIFCQLNHTTADGVRYRNLYRPPSIPSIAIIDPLTRGKMWDCHADLASDVIPGKTGPSPAALAKGEVVINPQFIARLQRTLKEWADRKDLQVDPIAPVKSAAQQEDALLQAAINASLEGAAHNPSPDEYDLTNDVSGAAASSSAAAAAPARSPVKGLGRSAPIVLDDDDDDSEGWQQDDVADEEYVQISDSDGELDPHMVSRDSTDEVAVLPAKRVPRKQPSTFIPRQAAVVIDADSPAASATPSSAVVSGDKRKRQLVESSEEESKSQPAAGKHPRLSPTKASKSAAPPPTASTAALAPPPPAVAPVFVPDEPAVGSSPLVCRLQVRLPSGKSVQRRFLKTDPIRLVVAFARSLLPDEIKCKQLTLLSIEEHGVAGASVIIEVVDP